MKRKIQIGIGVVVVLIAAYYFFLSPEDENVITYKVKKNTIELSVTASGELEAKNSVPIMGPTGLRNLRIWQIKIEKLIDEGSVVKKGDYVGELSKSEVVDKLKAEESELIKSESQLIQTRLDTTIELSQARNEIKNLEYNLKEQEIVVEQSIYEPPATIRQAKNSLEKAKKSLKDAIENYQLKLKKARAKMREVQANLGIVNRRIDQIRQILGELVIYAPENGMVIYKRDWDGKKYTVGSMIGSWSPVVATLPDMSSMISKTYINEVDISKIKVGQEVVITLDAFPDEIINGRVIAVSNVGQQISTSDGKVFEVSVELEEVTEKLRPAMTTSNTIIQEVLKDRLSIPLDAVYSIGDSINYAFRKSGFGISRQEIQLGRRNEVLVEVLKGLNEGDEILLTAPQNAEDLELSRLEGE